MDEYLQVTKPLAISLDTLQGNYASLGFVLPSIVKLQNYYKQIISEKSLTLCEPFAKFILKDLKKRTEEYFNDKDYILGKLV